MEKSTKTDLEDLEGIFQKNICETEFTLNLNYKGIKSFSLLLS